MSSKNEQRMTTEQVGYRHRLKKAAQELRSTASMLKNVNVYRIDYVLLGDLDDVLRKLEGLRAQISARPKP